MNAIAKDKTRYRKGDIIRDRIMRETYIIIGWTRTKEGNVVYKVIEIPHDMSEMNITVHFPRYLHDFCNRVGYVDLKSGIEKSVVVFLRMFY